MSYVHDTILRQLRPPNRALCVCVPRVCFLLFRFVFSISLEEAPKAFWA